MTAARQPACDWHIAHMGDKSDSTWESCDEEALLEVLVTIGNWGPVTFYRCRAHFMGMLPKYSFIMRPPHSRSLTIVATPLAR